MISDVSDSCSFIVSLAIPFDSSMINFRFRLAFLSVPTDRGGGGDRIFQIMRVIYVLSVHYGGSTTARLFQGRKNDKPSNLA